MSLSNLRLKNLLKLIDNEYKNQADFSNKAGYEPSFISQLVTGRRNCGEKVARKIEGNLGLPVGYLDREQDSNKLDSVNNLDEQSSYMLGELNSAITRGKISKDDLSLLYSISKRLYCRGNV